MCVVAENFYICFLGEGGDCLCQSPLKLFARTHIATLFRMVVLTLSTWKFLFIFLYLGTLHCKYYSSHFHNRLGISNAVYDT